jgi:hypothetical protein
MQKLVLFGLLLLGWGCGTGPSAQSFNAQPGQTVKEVVDSLPGRWRSSDAASWSLGSAVDKGARRVHLLNHKTQPARTTDSLGLKSRATLTCITLRSRKRGEKRQV